jgi:para-aminobenzoate synthetase/4-amino-4-deoxychorismate lyase
LNILFQFNKTPLYFSRPKRVITCREPGALPGAFEEMEAALGEGLTVAGYLSYEAGYALERKLVPPKISGFPLACFGCFEGPSPLPPAPRADSGSFGVAELRLNMTQREYVENIQRIRDYIAAGDVYQITYCLKIHFDFRGDPRALYASLLREQPVPYPAMIEQEGRTILSLSPEMFLRKKGTRVTTRPMKGTWPRGKRFWTDLLARRAFYRDEKNRAENTMIVDLLRNDLGRIGREIRARKLYEVTPYRTLFQMTSTVEAKLSAGLKVHDLLKSLFPSGSVTGAPKIRAMEIIQELEREERKIYTGAIGYITPDRGMFFNIPIRTLLLEGGRGEMGIGGGIVWDSTPEGEWEEGRLKAKFFTDLAGSALSGRGGTTASGSLFEG